MSVHIDTTHRQFDQAARPLIPYIRRFVTDGSSVRALRALGGVLLSLPLLLLQHGLGSGAAHAEPPEDVPPCPTPDPLKQSDQEDKQDAPDPLGYFCSVLETFRPCFSRERTFLWFVVVLMGFVLRYDHLGVSSFVRALELSAECYPALLGFFRSSAWTLGTFLPHWWNHVMQQPEVQQVNDRAILVGDDTFKSKEACKTPGVVTAYDHSETSSRPSYFRAHVWAVLTVLLTSGKHVFATPLAVEIHQGREELGEPAPTDQKLSMTTRMVDMAIKVARTTGHNFYLVLDAYFGTGPVFLMARSAISDLTKLPLVHIVTAMKTNTVAYAKAIPTRLGRTGKRRAGRNRKYGPRLKLMELFDAWPELFTTASLLIYGEQQDVRYLCLNLLWKPIKDELRFVLIESTRGRKILATTDLNLDPTKVIELYCWRWKVETLISVLKHVIGAFRYRFWTTAAKRKSRRPRKNSPDAHTYGTDARAKIRSCWSATEKFVTLGAIATGLLQIISIRYQSTLWRSNTIWMRTYSGEVPSEFLTKLLLAQQVRANLRRVKPHATLRKYMAVTGEAGKRGLPRMLGPAEKS